MDDGSQEILVGGVAVVVITMVVWVVSCTLVIMSDGSHSRFFDVLVYLAVPFAFAPGITQIVYSLPLYLRWKGHVPERSKGVLIAASLVLLLNTGCYVLFATIAN